MKGRKIGYLPLIAAVTVFLPVFFAMPVQGIEDYVNEIPNGFKFSCDNCHFPTNEFFKQAFRNNGLQWDATLAGEDADSDGCINGLELQDTNGFWRPGQPNPGDPALVSNPTDRESVPPGSGTATPTQPVPTRTPTPPTGPTKTPTPIPPTWTPTTGPTDVPTNTPVIPTDTPIPPTDTPAGCDTTGVTIYMPSNFFRPGDLCYCDAIVCNAEGSTLVGYPLFVILDVFGSYFFAPSFGDFDYYMMNFPPDETFVTVLPEFNWPEGAGSANGIIWYGAMTNPEMSALFGELGMFTFGWGV